MARHIFDLIFAEQQVVQNDVHTRMSDMISSALRAAGATTTATATSTVIDDDHSGISTQMIVEGEPAAGVGVSTQGPGSPPTHRRPAAATGSSLLPIDSPKRDAKRAKNKKRGPPLEDTTAGNASPSATRHLQPDVSAAVDMPRRKVIGKTSAKRVTFASTHSQVGEDEKAEVPSHAGPSEGGLEATTAGVPQPEGESVPSYAGSVHGRLEATTVGVAKPEGASAGSVEGGLEATSIRFAKPAGASAGSVEGGLDATTVGVAQPEDETVAAAIVHRAVTDPWYEEWGSLLQGLPLDALPKPEHNHGAKTYKLCGNAANITVRLDNKSWYVKPVLATRVPDSVLEAMGVRRDSIHGVSIAWSKHGMTNSWTVAKKLAEM